MSLGSTVYTFNSRSATSPVHGEAGDTYFKHGSFTWTVMHNSACKRTHSVKWSTQLLPSTKTSWSSTDKILILSYHCSVKPSHSNYPAIVWSCIWNIPQDISRNWGYFPHKYSSYLNYILITWLQFQAWWIVF
jgi:hypothetical protein